MITRPVPVITSDTPARFELEAWAKSRMWLMSAEHAIGNALAFLDGDNREHAQIIAAGIKGLREKVERTSQEASGTMCLPKIERNGVRR